MKIALEQSGDIVRIYLDDKRVGSARLAKSTETVMASVSTFKVILANKNNPLVTLSSVLRLSELEDIVSQLKTVCQNSEP